MTNVLRLKARSFHWSERDSNIEEVTMKVNYLEKRLPPVGFLARDSLSGVAELVKELLRRAHVQEDKISYWQLILLQSKANGCSYLGGDLPESNWEWPKNTWFQERLSHHLRELEFVAQRDRNQAVRVEHTTG